MATPLVVRAIAVRLTATTANRAESPGGCADVLEGKDLHHVSLLTDPIVTSGIASPAPESSW